MMCNRRVVGGLEGALDRRTADDEDWHPLAPEAIIPHAPSSCGQACCIRTGDVS